MRAGARLERTLARRAQLESLAQHGAQRPEPLQHRRRRTDATAETRGEARPVGVAADRFDDDQRPRRRRQSGGAAAASARARVQRRSRPRDEHADRRRAALDEDHRRLSRRTPRAAPSPPPCASSAGITDGIHDPPHQRVVAVHLRRRGTPPVAVGGTLIERGAGLGEIGRARRATRRSATASVR